MLASAVKAVVFNQHRMSLDMFAITIIATVTLGSLVGFSLGLTGGGGAIFAVPLLVYGLGIPAKEAVGISLLTVGCTASVGLLQRARLRLVDFPVGLVFALAGMIGAPFGSWFAQLLPEDLLLLIFACLMLLIAGAMWLKTTSDFDSHLAPDNSRKIHISEQANSVVAPSLQWTPTNGIMLGSVGLCAGILSGMFGVGGGFIIVPALVSFVGMGMQRAIGTSLLAITLISLSGFASHALSGKSIAWDTSTYFLCGSVLGLLLGSLLAQKLAGALLQRIFAVAIVSVAFYVILRSVLD